LSRPLPVPLLGLNLDMASNWSGFQSCSL
jgi:hypothetical protein